MNKLRLPLQLIGLMVVLSMLTFAATEYVIVNNGNSISNSVTIYKLNEKTGELTRTAVLDTGGQGQVDVPDFSQVEEAFTPDAGCIFVLDDGSSDIAAFSKATGYRRVGSYFNSNLISNGFGGSLSLRPDGKFLYASYSVTGNIGAWEVRTDCKLVLLSTYELGEVGQIAVAPNGKDLVASGQGIGASLFAIDKLTGNLTFVGDVAFRTGACARGCYPAGVDITKDSKFAVFASIGEDARRQHPLPVAITTRITPQGLVSTRIWNLKNSAGLFANYFPFFGASAYTGLGAMYFAIQGQPGLNPGVLTANFNEHPLSIKLNSAVTIENGPEDLDGNIAVTANLIVIAQYPKQISVFRIKKSGSLTLLSTTTIDEQGEGLFSLSVFPNTR